MSHLKLTRVTWSKCEVKRILYECCFWYSTIPNKGKSTYFPYKCQDQEWKYSNWESFEGWFDWWWDPAVQIFAPISLAETLNQPKIDENFIILIFLFDLCTLIFHSQVTIMGSVPAQLNYKRQCFWKVKSFEFSTAFALFPGRMDNWNKTGKSYFRIVNGQRI